MGTIEGIIFDLGGTLVDWPDWDTASEDRWGMAYDYLRPLLGEREFADRQRFVQAMRAAELAHWERVEREYWSGPPTSLLQDGYRRLAIEAGEVELVATLDGYARAVSGWAEVFPDSRQTLLALRARGYPIGLLSNTWWAAAWHNADLAAHGLNDLLDELIYTSDLPHSKPHPSVFEEAARRLGVRPENCVMIGDRPIDDIQGALSVGMRGIFKTNRNPRPVPAGLQPTAIIATLSELPPLIERLSTGDPSE
ncbi:MAG: HAD family hydrolase [Dehalococcoidia bacterium]